MASAENASIAAAVRPPEYWPSPIVFALADAADRFVLADTLQYSRQSFQNRARVRTPQGWQWISVPLKGGQHGCPICEVEIRNRHRWMGKHWRALHYNYRTTPFFEFFEPRLKPLFEKEWDRLGPLTCATIELIAELLGMATPLTRASEMNGQPNSVPGILEVCGTNRLMSGSDTAEVDRHFADSLHVVDLEALRYRQNFEGFASGMSTLDLLFNYGPETLSMIRRAAVVQDEVRSSSN